MFHENVKILDKYASLHKEGLKPWEIRKNDRNYKVDDLIQFIVINSFGNWTGESYIRRVTYLYKGTEYGLKEGYCIMTVSN